MRGPASGSPSVMVSEYGGGRILVDLGNPSTWAVCPPSDEAIRRDVDSTIATTVATEATTWSSARAPFR